MCETIPKFNWQSFHFKSNRNKYFIYLMTMMSRKILVMMVMMMMIMMIMTMMMMMIMTMMIMMIMMMLSTLLFYWSYTYRDLLAENLFNIFSFVYSSQPIRLRVSFLHVWEKRYAQSKSQTKCGGNCRLFINLEFSLYPYYWDNFRFSSWNFFFFFRINLVFYSVYKVFSKIQIPYFFLTLIPLSNLL
jgi:hypothetical protein